MAPQIQRVLPLPEAATRMGIPINVLTRLISNGMMKAVQLPDGTLAVTEKHAKEDAARAQLAAKAAPRKQDAPEYKKHAHLRGKSIGVAEAAREYGVTVGTVARWVQRGYIARLGQDGQKILIDQADVAYCVEIYRKHGAKQGRRLFNLDGTEYVPRTRRASN